MRKLPAVMLLVGLTLATLGCGADDDPRARNYPRDVSGVPGGPVTIDPATINPTPQVTPQPMPPASPDSFSVNSPELDPTKSPVEATADTVGTKGKDYGGGIITEPISQYFRIQDRLKLQQLDYALKLYYAEHGRYPANMQQYIDEIARPNQVSLPDLPANREYVYDPQQGKLFVQSK